MKRILKEYFTFTRKERNAMLVLLLLIAFFIAVPYFYPVKQKPALISPALQDLVARSKRLAADSADTTETDPFSNPAPEKRALVKQAFPFNPNTVSDADWKRLGMNEKTLRTIRNYTTKGGRFRKAEDLRKIWGIRKEDADRLIPYVVLEEKQTLNKFPAAINRPVPAAKTRPQGIDINTATEEEWRSLPGIGEVLAARIIKYRERAGGFAVAEQVKKIYGISDSVFALIRPFLSIDPASAPKLNLNTASFYQLKNQLSLTDPVARAILVYRQEYGLYTSVTDLKKLPFMPDSLYQRISKQVVAE